MRIAPLRSPRQLTLPVSPQNIALDSSNASASRFIINSMAAHVETSAATSHRPPLRHHQIFHPNSWRKSRAPICSSRPQHQLSNFLCPAIHLPPTVTKSSQSNTSTQNPNLLRPRRIRLRRCLYSMAAPPGVARLFLPRHLRSRSRALLRPRIY